MGKAARTRAPSAAIPTVDESVEPSGLDLSDTVTALPPGTTCPVGRLEFSPGMDLYVVIAPDGQLAVANLNGELVVTIEGADLPVWSGSGMMFSTPGRLRRAGQHLEQRQPATSASIPARGRGEQTMCPSAATAPRSTTCASIRICRASWSFAPRRSTDPTMVSIWSSDSITLGGARPAWLRQRDLASHRFGMAVHRLGRQRIVVG